MLNGSSSCDYYTETEGKVAPKNYQYKVDADGIDTEHLNAKNTESEMSNKSDSCNLCEKAYSCKYILRIHMRTGQLWRETLHLIAMYVGKDLRKHQN